MKLFGFQVPAVLSPIEQALRAAAEKLRQLQARDREQLKKDHAQRRQQTEAQLDQLQHKISQMQARLDKAREARMPADQLANLRQHLDVLQAQVRSLLESSSAQRAEKTTFRPDAERSAVPELRAQLRESEAKIQAAKERGLPEVVISRLEIQAAALEHVLAHAEAHQTPPGVPVPKALQLSPGVTAQLLSLSELRARIAQVKAALEQLGTGFELTAEPGKLREAEGLRHELWALTQAFSEAAERNFSPPARADGLSSEQWALLASGELGGAPGVVAPEVKAFVASYYGDKSDLGDAPLPEQHLDHANLQTATQVASSFSKAFLGLPLDDPFFADKREKWLSMATGFMVQHQGDAQAARAAMERALLKSEDGFFPVLRDLRFGFREALHQGAISPQAFDQADLLLKRLGQPVVTSWISAIVDRSPTATKNEVVKELFVELTRALGHQRGPLTPAAGMRLESARAISGKHIVSG